MVVSQSPFNSLKGKSQQGGGSKASRQSLASLGERPTAILFDWDNTLVDNWKSIFYAINDTLLAFGLEPWSEEVAIENIQHSGRDSFPKLFGDRAQEAQKLFYKLFSEDNLQNLNPMPHAESLLELLLEKEIPTAIVSNKGGEFLRKEINHLGWGGYFQALVGAGDALRDKPAADPILLALKHLDIPVTREVWMIGDAPVDWDCALAAGCQPIAFGNRFEQSSSMLVSIENCGELKNYFSKM